MTVGSKPEYGELSGIKVLVTRPAHQAQPLCDMISLQGGQAVRLATIAIEPVTLAEDVQQQISQLEQIDRVIFISPNAVEYGLAQLLAQGKIPDKLKFVTIGKASADKLLQLLGRAPDIYPIQQYNSEALLALPQMQAAEVEHKRILIFRGKGGRELLATTLKQRGAQVHYAEVYQRIIPQHNVDDLRNIVSQVPDIATVTSDEGLNNLVSLFTEQFEQQQLEQFWQMPLVVVTDKMRLNAQKLGFKNAIMVAAKASNEALLDTIRDWAKNIKTDDKRVS